MRFASKTVTSVVYVGLLSVFIIFPQHTPSPVENENFVRLLLLVITFNFVFMSWYNDALLWHRVTSKVMRLVLQILLIRSTRMFTISDRGLITSDGRIESRIVLYIASSPIFVLPYIMEIDSSIQHTRDAALELGLHHEDGHHPLK